MLNDINFCHLQENIENNYWIRDQMLQKVHPNRQTIIHLKQQVNL